MVDWCLSKLWVERLWVFLPSVERWFGKGKNNAPTEAGVQYHNSCSVSAELLLGGQTPFKISSGPR